MFVDHELPSECRDLLFIPYNTASIFHKLHCPEIDLKWGGDCIHIAEQTKQRLDAMGLSSEIIQQDKPGKRIHHANLLRLDGSNEEFYFDARFAMNAFLPISRNSSCNSYPALNTKKFGHSGTSRLLVSSDREFKLQTLSRITGEDIFVSFNLDQPWKEISNLELAKFSINTLNFSIIDKKSLAYINFSYSLRSAYYLIKYIGVDESLSGKHKDGTSGFQSLLNIIESQTDISFRELIAHFSLARETYFDLKKYVKSSSLDS